MSIPITLNCTPSARGLLPASGGLESLPLCKSVPHSQVHKTFIFNSHILICAKHWAIRNDGGSAKMKMARLVSILSFFFTALTLVHAGFVDYRSGGDIQSQYKLKIKLVDSGTKSLYASQYVYLQVRKYAGSIVETLMAFRNTKSGSAIWRGLIRAQWTERGLCCGVFDLMVRMKGGNTRIRLLESLSQPRNKLQLSNELGIDWKAVDRHIGKLVEYGLICEVISAGTCRLFMVTEKGRRALSLLHAININTEYESDEHGSKVRSPVYNIT